MAKGESGLTTMSQSVGGGSSKTVTTLDGKEIDRADATRFGDDWVETPHDMAGWALLGRLGEQMEGKTADELKRMVAENAGDLKVGDISRMRNAEKIKQKVLEAAQARNLEYFKKNPSWLIHALAGGEYETRQIGGVMYSGNNRGYEGRSLVEALGVKPKLYNDRAAGKDWYRTLSRIVHPDNNLGNPEALAAFGEINRVYSRMSRNWK